MVLELMQAQKTIRTRRQGNHHHLEMQPIKVHKRNQQIPDQQGLWRRQCQRQLLHGLPLVERKSSRFDDLLSWTVRLQR